MKLAIYNLLILLLIPVFQLRLLFKSIKDSDYRFNFSQRFGRKLSPFTRKKEKIIWFHAVSLGEVIGSQDIIKELLKDFDVVLTTSTPTGLRKALELFKDSVAINYAPFDLNTLIKKFLDFYNPDALLIFETEIWPSMISTSRKKNIPVFLINGRLSKNSFQTYLMTSWFIKNILLKITFVFVQSEKHQERFIKLGVNKKNIKVAGSVKFDAPGLNSQPISLPPYLLGASTHSGEEEILLNVFNTICNKYPYKLLICPRHPERSNQILQLATKMGFKAQLYSQLTSNNFKVCIVDSIGLLPDFYHSAKLAFVGGSLVPRGGHNIIEPAVLGTPIITGNHTFNFEDIVQDFIEKDACILVHNEHELLAGIQSILGDAEVGQKLSINAKKIVETNQGSTQIQLSYILDKLGAKN